VAPFLGNEASAGGFAPELWLSAGALSVLVIDRLMARSHRRAAVAVGLTLTFLAIAALATFQISRVHLLPVGIFNGLLVIDPWAIFFRYLFWTATGLAVLMAAPSREISAARMGEYCALLLAISVGLSMMTAAADLVVATLGLELVSIVSYALAGFRSRNRASAEAALKYVIYGGVATGLMLFGMSWLYGMLGTTSMIGGAQSLSTFLHRASAEAGSPQGALAVKAAVILSVVLVLSGIGFKVASVPWHMWCPDVYEGAPTPFTAFLSVAPKAAGFGLLVRFTHSVLQGVDIPWAQTLGVLAALTMTWGNVAALSQTNLKRLLAYSSIAHAGYLLMGVAATSVTGTESVALYLVLYLFMNLGAFLAVGVVSRLDGEGVLYEFRGLSSRAPFTAIAMALFLFSLTGVPPLAGFVGKFYLVKSLVDAGARWHLALALLGLFNSVLSLYYYARVVKAMFVDRPTTPTRLEVPASYNFLLGFFALAVVAFGIYFDGLKRLASASAVMFGAQGL
jgi:NADH-quinone oxidoreductase subunit N